MHLPPRRLFLSFPQRWRGGKWPKRPVDQCKKQRLDAPSGRTPNAQWQKQIAAGKDKKPGNGSTVGRARQTGGRGADLPRPCLRASWKPPRSDGDSVQAEHLGLVSKELGTEGNDAASYRIEVLNLVGLELLEQLSEALDEAALLLARVVVRAAKLQEDLVI